MGLECEPSSEPQYRREEVKEEKKARVAPEDPYPDKMATLEGKIPQHVLPPPSPPPSPAPAPPPSARERERERQRGRDTAQQREGEMQARPPLECVFGGENERERKRGREGGREEEKEGRREGER